MTHRTRTQAKSSQPVTRGKRLVFVLLACLGLPLIMLTIGEMSLRLMGYGFATGFFKRATVGGELFLVQNEKFGLRFFPPETVRQPEPLRMHARKQAGVRRIFILGESAAMGDPETAFGPARFLEVMLRERHPQEWFEIVNVSFTAINSHVLLPLARECARHDGDVWVVYLGNNELVGPFGAGTVFGSQAPSLAVARGQVAVQSWRLGQWMVQAGRRWKLPSGASKTWQGMEMFKEMRVAPDDPARVSIARSFVANLRDILQSAREADVPVILCSVAVNLDDCPPFASVESARLTTEERSQFQALMESARIAQSACEPARAIELCKQAAELDPHYAELHYRWGAALRALTNQAAALDHFQLACDYDALPFRADSEINRVIRDVARSASDSVTYLDVAGGLADARTPGTGDDAFFYEHVHFNPVGAYEVGRIWAVAVEQELGLPSDAAWPTREACSLWLGLNDWNRALVLDGMLQRLRRPPLVTQLNHSVREQRLRAEIQAALAGVNPARATEVEASLRRQLERYPRDWLLWKAYAYFLQSQGKLAASVDAWNEARALVPENFLADYQIGRHLTALGRFAEAGDYLRRAVASRPCEPEAYFALGLNQTGAGRWTEAAETFRTAARYDPAEENYVLHQSRALARCGQAGEALDVLKQFLESWPGNYEVMNEAGLRHLEAGELAAADAVFKQVLRSEPGRVETRINLGALRVRQGDLAGGAAEFEAVLQTHPANRIAAEYLRRVRERLVASP